MLFSVELTFKSSFFKFVHIFQLFYLFGKASLKFNSHIFSHLNVFSVCNIMVMKNIHISNSLSLQISIKLLAPLA